MRIRSLLVAASLALGLAAFPVAAQNCSVPGLGGTCSLNHTISATVPTVASLTLSSASTPSLVTAADFAAGAKSQMGPFLLVAANTAWALDVRSSASTWTGTSGADPDKPAGDLEIQLNAGSFIQVSTTDQELASGTPMASTQSSTTLRTTWSYVNDTPGNYSLTLVFTLAAP